jgi:NitT/TauT family transport system substrate-binding protein
MRSKPIVALACLGLLAAFARPAASAETIRFGVSQFANDSPVAIALAKGYFKAEGLQPKLTIFHAQAPIAVAVGSGSLDFGDAAQTAALYNLAHAGRARIIASGAAEAPGFHTLALVVSNKAYAEGLKSPRDLPGHSFALTQMGTGLQYALGLVAAHEGFDPNTVTLRPLQSNPNIASALAGGQADAAAFDMTNAMPLIAKHEVHVIGYVGDLAGLNPAFLVFASIDMIEHHPATVKRFLAAYRKATRDYHDAFTDPHGKREDEPTAAATVAMIADWVHQSPERVKLGLPYIDREGRVDMRAVQDQIDWYHSIGAIKPKVRASEIVDKRFAIEIAPKHVAAH